MPELAPELVTMPTLAGASVVWNQVQKNCRYPLDGRTGLLVRGGEKAARLKFSPAKPTAEELVVDVGANEFVVIAGLSRPDFHADGVGVSVAVSAPVDIAVFRL